MSHYEKIISSSPVNKQAGLVTQQSGSREFLLSDREQLRVLGERKKHLMDLTVNLKKEIGIDQRAGSGSNTKYPRKILRHPDFKTYMGMKETLSALDSEIFEIKQRLKQVEAPKSLRSFENHFVDLVKEKYPNIFDEIKKKIHND